MGLNSTNRANNPRSIYGKGKGNVTTTRLSNEAYSYRRTIGEQWHQVIIDNNRTLWRTDMVTSHRDVANHPLQNIARRNSSSDLHVYSGVHGAKKGNNGLRQLRMPYLNELDFYIEDTVFKSRSSQYTPNRKVYLIDMAGTNKNTFSEHLSRSGHHVQAYCFSRNDNFLLKRFNLEPVTSYHSFGRGDVNL
ncbi:hypothetical protein [Serratia symbiotica]|uniref:hypothetical protein n=1 Tax=Serratia symbiotica TaxID=138074 RepID=UPI0025463FF0|nr:hypothetical protein [Serratia symbiotica]